MKPVRGDQKGERTRHPDSEYVSPMSCCEPGRASKEGTVRAEGSAFLMRLKTNVPT